MIKYSIAAVAVAATVGSYLSLIEHHSAPIHRAKITSSIQIPKSFQDSSSVKIANPNNHISIQDTRSIIIRVPGALSDATILARFVNGFFGGYSFGPERSVLQLLGRNITDLGQLSNIPVSSQIWSLAQLSPHKVPEPHSQLFGAFRVVDVRLQPEPSDTRLLSEKSQSYIDFAYGSDNGLIAGVHRFSVSRGETELNDEENESADEAQIKLEFASFSCNPRKNERLGPNIVQTFHMWYAMLLFRESVAAVIKG